MADTEAQKKVESTVEEKKVEEKVAEKAVDKDEPKVEENGDKAENGDGKKDVEEIEKTESEEPTTDKCCIKRKSTGGDAIDGKVDDTTTPEKKAKLDEEAPAEAETAA